MKKLFLSVVLGTSALAFGCAPESTPAPAPTPMPGDAPAAVDPATPSADTPADPNKTPENKESAAPATP
jgi:hypothetical protein